MFWAWVVIARETWIAPTQASTWAALVYLVLSSMPLFIGFLHVVKRWTASATAYGTLFTPLVTVAIGAVLAGELVSPQFVVGTALVMAGVYVGAMRNPHPRRPPLRSRSRTKDKPHENCTRQSPQPVCARDRSR